MTVINAFHKDFCKTYMPELLNEIRIQNKHKMSSHHMAEYTEELRKTNPALGTIHHLVKPLHVMRAPEMMKKKKKSTPIIDERNMTMAEVMDDLAVIKQKKLTTKQRIDLAPKEFKIFSRAGTANVTPKGKKK
jgi:flagellar biosynthesis component FlhA